MALLLSPTRRTCNVLETALIDVITTIVYCYNFRNSIYHVTVAMRLRFSLHNASNTLAINQYSNTK